MVRVDTFKVIDRVDVRFTLGRDTEICTAPYVLTAPFMDGAAYSWNTGSTTASASITKTGNYSVSLSKLGCSCTDEIAVTISDVSQQLLDTTLCKGESFSIGLKASVHDGASALWNTGNDSTIEVNTLGKYWVEVSMGTCTGSDTAIIEDHYCDCKYGFPTAFSPNNDGRNDAFRLVAEEGCPIKSYQLNIYNRWGERVSTVTEPWKGWEGSYKGEPAGTGAYMYTVEFVAGDKWVKHEKSGSFVLIR